MFEFGLPFCVGAKRMAGLCFALRLDREHFPGVIKNGSGSFAFGARPFRIGERSKRGRFFANADVATGNQERLPGSGT